MTPGFRKGNTMLSIARTLAAAVALAVTATVASLTAMEPIAKPVVQIAMGM
ncbi:MAG: hypothetical protein AAFW98_14830 [Pseudomonadota bacterium]